MPPLSDLPELVGFFSYSREDDEDFDNTLSQVRTRIQNELRGQLGRSRQTLRLFQDREAIAPGTLWASEIQAAIAQSAFFIPILSPRAVRSQFCGMELQKFLDREQELGRRDLVFPILFINIPELGDDRRRGENPVLRIIAERQYVDWRQVRYNPDLPEARQEIAAFCEKIVAALHRVPPSEEAEEKLRAEGAAAAARAKEEEDRRAEEARRRAEAEAKARAQEEAEAAAARAWEDEDHRRRQEAKRRAAKTEHAARAATFPEKEQAKPGPANASRRHLLIRAALAACAAAVIAVAFWIAARLQIPVTPSPSSESPTAPQASTDHTPLTPAREAALKPGDLFTECKNCPEMVVIPAGSFTMGSSTSETGRDTDEGPQHTVKFAAPFAVGRFALTFDQWDACADDGGCNGYHPADQGWGRGRRPAINVSWDDAKTYLAWLSAKTGRAYRLLSEAEYEYGTRAGTTSPYYWGNEIGRGNANCSGCGSQWDSKQTGPVGSFALNTFGLYDMSGNVWQWVEDCYHGSYQGAPTDGSAWKSGDCGRRVVRGGSWEFDPQFLRSAARAGITPDPRVSYIGFRVGRTLVVMP